MKEQKKPAKLTLKVDASKKQELEKLFKKPPEVIPEVTKESKSIKATGGKEELKSEAKDLKKEVVKEASKNSEPASSEKVSKKKKHQIIEPKDYMAVLKYLQNSYPQCFSKPELKPLEIGIRERLLAIEELPFSNGNLKNFLKAYTRTKKYKQSLVVGVARVNLAGEETSKVLEEEAIKASPSTGKR